MTSGIVSASKSSDSAPINPDRELTRLLGALLRRAISTLDSFMMTPIRSCCLIFFISSARRVLARVLQDCVTIARARSVRTARSLRRVHCSLSLAVAGEVFSTVP